MLVSAVGVSDAVAVKVESDILTEKESACRRVAARTILAFRKLPLEHVPKRHIQKVDLTIFHQASGDFYDFTKSNLKKQNQIISYSFRIFENIYQATYSRNSGKIFYANDYHDNLHAASLIIWDDIQAYYLISTINPDFRNSGAGTLLIREAISHASTKTIGFDFEGSMIESVENSFRQFGAVQKPYFQITKINSTILKLRNCLIQLSQ